MKIIREMTSQDNAQMAKIIVNVLVEHEFSDSSNGGYDTHNLPLKIRDLYTYIKSRGGKYFVIEDTIEHHILGGGGYIVRLQQDNSFFSQKNPSFIELEKLYFLPEIRGTGLATELLMKIESEAHHETYPLIYVETEPSLSRAIRFYEKSGFKKIQTSKTNSICFIKDLKANCQSSNELVPTKLIAQ